MVKITPKVTIHFKPHALRTNYLDVKLSIAATLLMEGVSGVQRMSMTGDMLLCLINLFFQIFINVDMSVSMSCLVSMFVCVNASLGIKINL